MTVGKEGSFRQLLSAVLSRSYFQLLPAVSISPIRLGRISNMSRSLYKGPYVDPRVPKKIAGKDPMKTGVIKTWARDCVISPEMLGFIFGVHNGKDFIEVRIVEEMVGHRLG